MRVVVVHLRRAELPYHEHTHPLLVGQGVRRLVVVTAAEAVAVHPLVRGAGMEGMGTETTPRAG